MLAGIAARKNGGDTIDRLLELSGVDSRVRLDPTVRIDVERYAALYNLLVRELDDEGFGLFASPLRNGSFEFLCRGVMGSASLAEALTRATRFLRLILPDLAIQLEHPRSGPARLSITPVAGSPIGSRPTADPGRIFAFEWLLRLLHALACWLAGRGLPLDAVRFPYPRPQHAGDYALIYTEHSVFDPGAPALTAQFSASLLELPMRRDEAALSRFLDGAPGKIALLYRRDRETVQRVRDLLRRALPDLPSAPRVARELNVSERTLHRRLAAEGTNLRTVLGALRRDIALSRLAGGREQIASIAAELGFAEPSAFYRAVVGWTGRSPSAYRKSLVADR